MSVFARIAANARNLAELAARLRRRGFGRVAVLCLHMPAAIVLRAWRTLASRVNDQVLQPAITCRRFAAFVAGHPACGDLPRYYVIVMPDTLHFLLPCLALVACELDIVLLLNGARDWEAEVLRRRWPQLPQFRMATLPASSVSHGHAINMLLRCADDRFGLLDHDLYVFDRSLLARLDPAADELMVGVVGDTSADGRWSYPLTHLLMLNAVLLRDLIDRYRVGAESCRRPPLRVRRKLAEIGLREQEFLKDYHDFFDTLHVLLALGFAEGKRAARIETASEEGIWHVGGTSIDTHHSKDLEQIYVGLRFVERIADPAIARRYARLFAPFASAAQVRATLPMTPRTFQRVSIVDHVVRKLEAELAAVPFPDASPRRGGAQ